MLIYAAYIQCIDIHTYSLGHNQCHRVFCLVKKSWSKCILYKNIKSHKIWLLQSSGIGMNMKGKPAEVRSFSSMPWVCKEMSVRR